MGRSGRAKSFCRAVGGSCELRRNLGRGCKRLLRAAQPQGFSAGGHQPRRRVRWGHLLRIQEPQAGCWGLAACRRLRQRASPVDFAYSPSRNGQPLDLVEPAWVADLCSMRTGTDDGAGEQVNVALRSRAMGLLLIEDDITFANGIELLLKPEGFNVYSTSLGEEGIDLGKLCDYELILLEP